VEKFGSGEWTDRLVAEAAGGSEEARTRLSEQLLPRVRAMVIARLAPAPSQRHDVDDLTQECLIGVLEGVATLREPRAAVLRAFASTIVSRRTADYIRRATAEEKRNPRPRDAGASIDSDLWASILADSLSPGGSVAKRDEIRRILLALSGLKDRYRRIVTLAFIDQISMAEIAEQLGVSRPAASMLLMRAVRTLRRDITGRSDIQGDDSKANSDS